MSREGWVEVERSRHDQNALHNAKNTKYYLKLVFYY